jgi:peptide-methionine (R)-S-oxide reductase
MDETKAINIDNLTPEQIEIMKDGKSEAAFTGALLHNKKRGDYFCAACGAKIFRSSAKFDSHTGWPSFDRAIPGTTRLQADTSMDMIRTAVICANCGAHLGHLFEDGPIETTGQRYCINSACLNFMPKNK